MKRSPVLLIALCSLAGLVVWASRGAEGSGVVNFQNLRVDQVLEIYKGITQAELVVATNVKQASGRVTAGSPKDLKADEAARLLEDALLKQAAVIVTRLDSKRVSVTYNDRLELPVHRPTERAPLPSGR